MVGSCGLCLQTKELQNSHLIGAAFYKLLRDPTAGTDPNPVVATRSRAFTSSKQVASPFLCADCEGRFSDLGESYVSPQCVSSREQFPLRELLQAASPSEAFATEDGQQIKTYDAQLLLGSNIEHYLYFAASVFWRSAAHNWSMGSECVKSICLGEAYQEQFRQYLLGAAAFPRNARIWIHVSSESDPAHLLTIQFPQTFRLGKAHRHKFYVPGVLFILFLGSDVPRQANERALNSTKQQLVWLCPLKNDSLFDGFKKLIRGTTPTGKLRRLRA
jgi:hypothetical protein